MLTILAERIRYAMTVQSLRLTKMYKLLLQLRLKTNAEGYKIKPMMHKWKIRTKTSLMI